jgi:hypothetical protein
MRKESMTTAGKLAIASVLLVTAVISPAQEPAQDRPDYPRFSAGLDVTATMKVENSGEVQSLFDDLSFRGEIELSEFSRFYANIEVGELMGYNAGWTDGSGGAVSFDDGFDRTEVFIESDVLRQAGLDPAASVNIKLGYGSHQELLVMDFTQFRFERSSTSGIDGFNLSGTVGFKDRFYLTAALNPASFNNADKSGGSPRPDIFAALFMDNNHEGSSWGSQIRFRTSSMQLFYDSSANLENNRLYENPVPGQAMTLGIGGTLALDFAGIGIFGFGMTEYFLMYNRSDDDILQSEWGAGFRIPVLSGVDANLSGRNSVVFSGNGEGSYMNFGVDVKAMLTDFFGLFGAAAAVGILDAPGASFEGGFCFSFEYFQIYSGYSNHALWADPKYAKGAFDKVEVRPDGRAPGGGFFLTVGASF